MSADVGTPVSQLGGAIGNLDMMRPNGRLKLVLESLPYLRQYLKIEHKCYTASLTRQMREESNEKINCAVNYSETYAHKPNLTAILSCPFNPPMQNVENGTKEEGGTRRKRRWKSSSTTSSPGIGSPVGRR